MDFIELSPSLMTLMGGIISLYAYKANDVKATDEGRPFKASHLFFLDEKYINISFIWKRDTTEKVDNNWKKNNKQLHTPLLNEPESPAINLCLHIKILGFLFLGSSNNI